MRFVPDTNANQSGLLAIDTSTEQAGIALSTDKGVYAHSWAASRAQTTTVLPEINRMFSEAKMLPHDISGIIVAIGPGTFTGLRVGLAIAKGIVATRSVPLVGIPTLEIVFAQHPGEDIVAVLPAGRGRVVWQKRGQSPVNASIPELIASVADADLVGELTPDQEKQLREAGVSNQIEHRDPISLLTLGSQRLTADDVDDPVSLEPVYLHGVTVNAGPITDRFKK